MWIRRGEGFSAVTIPISLGQFFERNEASETMNRQRDIAFTKCSYTSVMKLTDDSRILDKISIITGSFQSKPGMHERWSATSLVVCSSRLQNTSMDCWPCKATHLAFKVALCLREVATVSFLAL